MGPTREITVQQMSTSHVIKKALWPYKKKAKAIHVDTQMLSLHTFHPNSQHPSTSPEPSRCPEAAAWIWPGRPDSDAQLARGRAPCLTAAWACSVLDLALPGDTGVQCAGSRALRRESWMPCPTAARAATSQDHGEGSGEGPRRRGRKLGGRRG